MTTRGTTAVVTTAGVALLERALAYTLGGLLLVTPEAMTYDDVGCPLGAPPH